MSRFSLYCGTFFTGIGGWQFLTLVNRSIPNYDWLYWLILLTLLTFGVISCTKVCREIYSGQFATNSPTWLTTISIGLVGTLVGVIFGWGF